MDRVDSLAADLSISRSECLERVIEAGVRQGEKDLAPFQNPVIRALIGGLMSSPKIMKVIGQLEGEPITDEEAIDGSQRARQLMQRKKRKVK